ncbi:XrtA system polysaccharide deacetylase [Flavobacterium sp. W21_SRS_FM6]|uniref:XrtA system polysaccharide deacetylase n=1 Tax=Flavobacterium sp. W21_SRS_FM6 TaxID=3240268 RepID=UPI003F8F8EC5
MQARLTKMVSAMTVDVEDYFQVSAFESKISPENWDSLSLRVEDNTNRLIDLFNERNIKSTFFTLGWVAQRCPNLIKRIVSEGHELASHGLNHRRATTMNEKEFFQDVSDSKNILEDISGQQVLGYRAPSFSIDESNTWTYSILVDLGFKYSSSTYPISHDLYGVPSWPRFKYLRPEGILEVPVSTIRKGNKNIGIGGGGYFRLYPYWYSKRRIEHYFSHENQPYNFYFHPWEIDPQQPKVKGASLKSKLRHYINLNAMEKKLIRLIDEHNWATMQSVYLDGNEVKSL